MIKTWMAMALAASMLHAGCGDAMESPTAPSGVTLATQHFAGSLSAGGTRFFSFTVSQDGSVAVMLASVTAPSGAPLSTPLAVGVGIPQGTGCALSTRTTTTSALVAQLVHSVTPGVYCVEVSDPGQVIGTVNFAARFTHP